jgi:diaminohydroxyphosphoribosylaminopyrimidine deaminase/5-amino-6-(5-phosphoribosylamino)uracil reductase
MPSRSDEKYMRRCLELAGKGAGRVSPNPMVGSVIVHGDEVIGEGYHACYGEAHAEVHAINAVSRPELLASSTLYVNLEPCAHFGKTPPCSDLIISKQIPRVVVGCRDPYPEVAGRGIGKLTDAGVSVTVGVLEEESLRLNEAFIKSQLSGYPFVALKIAQTLDGRIATSLGASKWITGEVSRTEVHRLRSRYDAVLAGASTVRADNAELTVRHCDGRQPLRVLLDRQLSLPVDARIFSSGARTLVFTSENLAESPMRDRLVKRGVDVVPVREESGGLDLGQVLRELHGRRVLSVMVEGGSRLSSAFVRQGLVDKLHIFIAPKLFGGDGLGSFAPLDVTFPEQAVNLRFTGLASFGDDLMIEAYFQ